MLKPDLRMTLNQIIGTIGKTYNLSVKLYDEIQKIKSK